MSLDVFSKRFLPAKNKLFRYALFFLKDSDEAHDVVQDVFMKVWNARDDWPTVINAEAWCMRMTRNISLDRLKAAGRNTQDLDAAMWVSADTDSPLAVAERRDDVSHLAGLIARLPFIQQETVRLRDIEGFSYEEIAAILQVDLGQVKINLHRARKFLREQLLKINAYGL